MRGSLVLVAIVVSGGLGAEPPSREETAVAAVVDDWHLAAAQVDESRYFSHLRDGAVFLGTDGTERWTKGEFQVWAHPFFQRGRAWTFKAKRRSITLGPDARMAWFDEDLDTPNLGPARGSGVLVKEQGRWRLAQYNLSVPIPNALMGAIRAQIEAHTKGSK